MPQQTKIFRVFVSSTFTDMKEERRILQRVVFPRLERFCEKRGARFQGVDLRWGVNEESQLDQQTLLICLNEISRCQRISPKPNFLILIGDKYGWQPIPPIIPKDEMESISEHLDEVDKSFIETWYKEDHNAIPPEYVLQPRGDKYKNRDSWNAVENKIRFILRNAVNKLAITTDQKVKYFASATHQEIIHGALNPPEEVEKPEDHVFAFVRQTGGLPEDETAKDFRDIADSKPDKDAYSRLQEIKSMLQAKLGKNFIMYNSQWNGSETEMAEPVNFGRKIYKKLRRIIDSQLVEVISPDEIEYETKLHREFKERLTKIFQGRKDIIGIIKDYLGNPAEKRVMSMIGASGSGKSSVMAESIRQAEADRHDALIIYRFIGATSRSSNLIYLLQSICGQIAKKYDMTLESLAGEGNEKSLYDILGLSRIFERSLKLATDEKPVIMFLDALDQLSAIDNAQNLHWLPTELPDHARVIVSTLPEQEGNLSKNFIERLPVLPVEEGEMILNQWLKAIKRKLTNEQFREVISKFSTTGLAIYLRLAFERARHWHSYDEDIDLKGDVKGIIDDFFDYLEREHTKEFVTNAICYMLCGRYQGLAENEILEVLAFDDEFWGHFLENTRPEYHKELIDQRRELKDSMKIPIAVWSRLYLDLEPFLTERDADGVPIITFFHRQFVEVLRERYKLDNQ